MVSRGFPFQVVPSVSPTREDGEELRFRLSESLEGLTIFIAASRRLGAKAFDTQPPTAIRARCNSSPSNFRSAQMELARNVFLFVLGKPLNHFGIYSEPWKCARCVFPLEGAIGIPRKEPAPVHFPESLSLKDLLGDLVGPIVLHQRLLLDWRNR